MLNTIRALEEVEFGELQKPKVTPINQWKLNSWSFAYQIRDFKYFIYIYLLLRLQMGI